MANQSNNMGNKKGAVPSPYGAMNASLNDKLLMLRMMKDLKEMFIDFNNKVAEISRIAKTPGPRGPVGLQGATGPRGKTGEISNIQEIAAAVLPFLRIPKDGAPGAPGQRGESYALTAQDIKDIASVATNMIEVPNREDITTDPQKILDAILALPKGKRLTSKHIDGLEQTISAIQHQLGRGYLHGGGMTGKAGAGITLTINSDGTTTISSSLGTAVYGEVPTGSGTAFSLAHTPVAGSVRLFRGGARQQAGASNDYTISGKNITLAVALSAGEILIADYAF